MGLIERKTGTAYRRLGPRLTSDDIVARASDVLRLRRRAHAEAGNQDAQSRAWSRHPRMGSILSGDCWSLGLLDSPMIARVRIAPTEHWCEFHARHLADARKRAICFSLEGMEIEILTHTMRMSVTPLCMGRLWSTVPETDEKLRAKGCSPSNDGICEHMLEMD